MRSEKYFDCAGKYPEAYSPVLDNKEPLPRTTSGLMFAKCLQIGISRVLEEERLHVTL
jgi:hypothetical protein